MGGGGTNRRRLPQRRSHGMLLFCSIALTAALLLFGPPDFLREPEYSIVRKGDH
jgi:hypothetical protein